MTDATTLAELWPVPTAVLVALFLWWFCTGLLFWLGRHLAGRHASAGLFGGALLLAPSLLGLSAVAEDTTVAGAYLSFFCGLGAWSFVELTFLAGALTGPVRRPCPAGMIGWPRFRLALGTVLWHELAIVAVGAVMLWISLGAPNQTGAWTFVLLTVMRISAKLNLFLGLPYPPVALLPAHLSHLESYFRVRRFTALLPAAITAGTALATLIAWHAAAPGLDPFHATAYALFWTLLVLGVAEHWFLILPVRESALWHWFIGPAPHGAAVLGPAPASHPGSHAAEGRPAPGLVRRLRDFVRPPHARDRLSALGSIHPRTAYDAQPVAGQNQPTGEAAPSPHQA
ncbi:MAG: putative photosynthetic complex assembly protein PuhE [Pseudomonadota bacterium]